MVCKLGKPIRKTWSDSTWTKVGWREEIGIPLRKVMTGNMYVIFQKYYTSGSNHSFCLHILNLVAFASVDVAQKDTFNCYHVKFGS